MKTFWLFLFGAFVIVLGSLLLLKRTARAPKIPTAVTPDPYPEEDNSW